MLDWLSVPVLTWPSHSYMVLLHVPVELVRATEPFGSFVAVRTLDLRVLRSNVPWSRVAVVFSETCVVFSEACVKPSCVLSDILAFPRSMVVWIVVWGMTTS